MAPRLSRLLLTAAVAALVACGGGAAGGPPDGTGPVAQARPAAPWNQATVYFLLLDRFRNGDPSNDGALGRQQDGALLRNFEGGDLKGVLEQLEAGYFDSLGVTAIWMTPFVEQVQGSVDEGTGRTYGYHGYWTRDWTAVDPAFGTVDDLRAVVDAAHRRGIRVLMDAVLNHTGPVTPRDGAWPEAWVRTSPQCTYQGYVTTTDCTLVANLPDLRTDRDEPVELPPFLLEKWRREGRLDAELAELEAFFRRTGWPRAPRYYVIKWLTDWVREVGFDGYRVDTAKHFAEQVSADLAREGGRAFADWKAANPGKAIDTAGFFVLGEVYGWGLGGGRAYGFGDRSVDYFGAGYDALINFAFKGEPGSLDDVFARYAAALRTGPLAGVSMLNYLASHDDGSPFDRDRQDPFGAAVRLLLAPGGAQIYYGDELARPLRIGGAEGDANLRSFMNWEDLAAGGRTAQLYAHWGKLGRFRKAHPAIGAGAHRRHQVSPYIFSRVLEDGARSDRVLVALGQPAGARTIPVFGVFAEGTPLEDAYSGVRGTVRGGAVALAGGGSVVLLAPAP